MTYLDHELVEKGVDDFALRIRRERRSRRIKQNALAEMAGVHSDTLRNVELGRHPAKASTVAKIVMALSRLGGQQ